MVNALGLRGDEGRGKLRKARGSCTQALYPWISEWDNLVRWRRIILREREANPENWNI